MFLANTRFNFHFTSVFFSCFLLPRIASADSLFEKSIQERFLQGLRQTNSIEWNVQPESRNDLLILHGKDTRSSYWLAVADPKQSRVEPVVSPNKYLVPVSQLVGPPCWAGINGGYFTIGGSLSLIVRDGQIQGRDVKNIRREAGIGNPARGVWIQTLNKLQSFGWATAIGDTIYRYREPVKPFEPIPHPRSDAIVWQPQFALGGGPMLVHKGKITDSTNEEMFDEYNIVPNDPAPRTAIAYTRQNLIVGMTADGRISQARGLSIPELSQLLHSLGANNALNLDGGASTTFVVNGEIKNTLSRPPQRSMTSGICFY
jgi:hypothetical protein